MWLSLGSSKRLVGGPGKLEFPLRGQWEVSPGKIDFIKTIHNEEFPQRDTTANEDRDGHRIVTLTMSFPFIFFLAVFFFFFYRLE